MASKLSGAFSGNSMTDVATFTYYASSISGRIKPAVAHAAATHRQARTEASCLYALIRARRFDQVGRNRREPHLDAEHDDGRNPEEPLRLGEEEKHRRGKRSTEPDDRAVGNGSGDGAGCWRIGTDSNGSMARVVNRNRSTVARNGSGEREAERGEGNRREDGKLGVDRPRAEQQDKGAKGVVYACVSCV